MLAGVTGVFVLLGFTPVGAASANLSRSYTASGSVLNGSLVSLDSKQADHIQLANRDNGSLLVGLVVASDDSLIAVDSGGGTVQVATDGTADALVSTLGGPIKVGDEIGVSPFSGIGTKASPGSRVIGFAQSAFNQGSDGAVKQTVTDKDGVKHQLTVGYVRVNIAIGTNGTTNNESQLNSLQRFALGLTGHVVPTFRVVIALVVVLGALLLLVTLIYAAIYGSIVSIGRNPLAKFAVFRTLGSVLGLAILTAVVSGLTIYFLLK